MSTVKTQITLKNAANVAIARRGFMTDAQVRTLTVEAHWQDRQTVCPALVVPEADEILFGALPMEGMDLIVHPRKEEIVGAHGDTALYKLK